MSAPSSEAPETDRRRFLALVFWAVNATIAAALSVPIVGFVAAPLFRKRPRVGVNVGELASFPLGRPQRVDFAIRKRDGWAIVTGRQSAWVVRTAKGVRVFDPRCTHLGCAYHWHAQTEKFLCPCHNGIYGIDGAVVSGPPPRPLDTYETWVDSGSLYVSTTPVRSA